MTRLIDAEKLKKHYAWWDDDEKRTLFDQIVDAQPTVDAEPVIRCKDCKFYEVAELNYDGTPDKRCKPSICANGWYEYAVERDPNWFCADAEPKENYENI